jgi:phosphoglycolate phosphatase-like HAD superfamily hydrolase
VLTGNLESVARAKLEAAGLSRYFLLGAYGSDAPERLDLPRIAVERARLELGFRFSPADVVIVGDTVYDVACASDFGAISVSVPSGVDGREALRAAGTTVLMKDAGDVVALQAAL